MAPKKIPMSGATIKALIAQGVIDALADYETNKSSRNGDDSLNSGNGGRRTSRTTQECTYKDFLNCQPLNSKGTKGVVGLTQCEGTYVVSYTQRFQALALMCGRMLPEESDQVEKYVGGLPDMIQDRLRTREGLTITQEITNQNSSLSKGKIWPGITQLGLMNRRRMVGLCYCAPIATIITPYRAMQSVQTAKGLVIWPVIVGVPLLPTTKDPSGQFKGLSHVLNVESKGTDIV
nr:hypothetical protein [Tanacetum cinerariifolium]GFA57316.1 hypothetical protein [Tanacetum cinerariifolium]